VLVQTDVSLSLFCISLHLSCFAWPKRQLRNKGITDAPLVYARRNCLMTPAHAGLVNGGRCLRLKAPLVGWDDCAQWSKLENVVIEGGGTLDANGDGERGTFKPCGGSFPPIDPSHESRR